MIYNYEFIRNDIRYTTSEKIVIFFINIIIIVIGMYILFKISGNILLTNVTKYFKNGNIICKFINLLIKNIVGIFVNSI